MMEKVLTLIFGSQHERDLKALLPILYRINEKESWAMSLPEKDFPAQTIKLKERLSKGETLDDILPEAYALVREAARRTLGERHYDVQLLGGVVLHQGKIMEMKTGEGKTLSSVTSAYLNSLTGLGVHVVTVNDYLAERDAQWMDPIYSYLGVSVGVILSTMDNEARKEAYSKDITYGTNNEFGFDYLRDNMQWSLEGKVQRGHNYAIIDEIDSILIDEARTPLIISGSAEDDTFKYTEVNKLIGFLTECEKDPQTGEYPEEPKGDFKIEEKNKRVSFTEEGMNSVETLLLKRNLIKGSLFTDENFEYIHYFTQALKAHKLFHLDVDYVVQEGLVQIVDEFTGRILHGRRYSDGLHQAIEAKEHIKIARRNRTLATITFQNYFRMYNKISGMTGTADTEAMEFAKIYNLSVVVIPTNRPLVRNDENDVIYFDEKFKYEAICDEIEKVHKKGQPILVGTVSIEKSELISRILSRKGIRHEVLNAKNHSREAMIIAEAGEKGSVTIATNMAGRGTDIKLGGSPDSRARKKCGSEASQEEYLTAFEKELKEHKGLYEEVRSLGGLYILGTERHESRRIDNQLRGRSGRQGDPGVSRFFLSLDDDLMRLFANENMKSFMGKMGMKDGEPIFHPWINKSIERAQTKVEERNFEIRKHLLEYDDVLNEQRNFIYRQRDEILKEGNLTSRVLQTAGELVREIVEEYHSSLREDPKAAYAQAEEKLKEYFFHKLTIPQEKMSVYSSEETVSLIQKDLEEDLLDKERQIGKERFNLFIRFEYLKQIDVKWLDHLENLEALREAVYLRAYGQKNPLLEYKLEGFQIFDTLIYDIRTNIAMKIMKIRIEAPERTTQAGRRVSIEASHRAMGQFSDSGSRQEMAAASPEKVQVKRNYPKVGRNDPCPCGSGKKYKYCHGS